MALVGDIKPHHPTTSASAIREEICTDLERGKGVAAAVLHSSTGRTAPGAMARDSGPVCYAIRTARRFGGCPSDAR